MNLIQAQVNIGGDPISFGYEKTGILTPLNDFEQMPPINMSVIEAEDAQWEVERAAGMMKIGRRFGITFEVDYDLHNSGIWTSLPDGGKVWRLGIECSGALSINLIFDQYRLPKGATLYIYGNKKSDKLGGFTDYNNQADNFFATDIVLDDKIIVEYYQPNHVEFDGVLRIANIIHGYRGLSLSAKVFGASGSCQRNTICPEGEGWEEQVRSVFALYSGNQELCSGTILNNTAHDWTPYALTANHCWDAAPNTGIWVFRFNWESSTCTPSTNSSDYKTMSGAVLRMRTATSTSGSDCCLVELNQAIPRDYGVYYAGWSRSTTPAPSAMCIHHPSLDIKKISPTKPLYTTTQYVQGWRADWSTGACTEGGSSGSGLFDHNHRIVGQLFGGESYCGAPASKMFDVYGRFDISWNGNMPSNRLKDWLDPLNLNPETLDGKFEERVDAELAAITIPESSYTSAASIEPTVTIKNVGDVPITAATVSYTIDGTNSVTKTWSGNLGVAGTLDVAFDTIKLTYGTHAFEATVTVFGDANSTNNKKSKSYKVDIEDAPYVTYVSHEVANGDLLAYSSTNTPIKVMLKNVGGFPTNGPITATISCDDPQLTINNSTAKYQTINVGETVPVTFNVTVARDIPDNKIFPVTLTVKDNETSWESKMTLKAYAPVFSLEKILVNGVVDGNLEAGTIVTLAAVVKNQGGAPAYNVKGDLDIISPYMTFACVDQIVPKQLLPAGGSVEIVFPLIIGAELPYGHEANINLLLNAQYGLSFSTPFKVNNSGLGTYCSHGDQNCSSNDKFTSVVLYKTSEPSNLLINNLIVTCSSGGYQDYTNLKAALEPGEQYTIKVQVARANNFVRGWFDLNGNNIFDSNEELIAIICGSPGSENILNFTVPADNFISGAHRFRLVTKYNSEPDACNNTNYGQTHDYTVVFPEIYPRAQNVEAKLSGNKITVTWKAPNGTTPDGYNIYRFGNRINAAPLASTTFTNENITEGVYAYDVTAIYGAEESFSETSNIVCNFEPCDAPAALTGVADNKNAVLNWEAPSATNALLGYNIYRDDHKVNETLVNTTSYRDENLAMGTYIYTVAAAYNHLCVESDLSAPASVAITVDINDTQTASCRLFPNPTNGNVTIEGTGLNRVEIFDIQGRQLAAYNNVNGTLQINVSNYENGIYFVRLHSGTNEMVVKRLVVIK
ncbi:MAG: T9SS type A sorting domain-containing protein [Lentimicrobiaceae bacterium]|nr:T9SS type A sorting domain-containing protein [Lentimicrobiaceae bacterium]